MSFIQSIGTALPEHVIHAEGYLRFMEQSHFAGAAGQDEQQERRRALERLVRRTRIRKRHTVLADYPCFYHRRGRRRRPPSTATRMAVYQREAPRLAARAAGACLAAAPHVAREQISHVIVVSCTGFFSPGLDIGLVRELRLAASVQRQIIGFMGCYAALNGLRAAHHICCADPNAVVLLVCVELCTLHFQAEAQLEAMVINSLFGDGAAAVLVTGTPRGAPGDLLMICGAASHLLPSSPGQPDMTWSIIDSGFRMTLSPQVPALVGQHIGRFIDGLLRAHGLRREHVDQWAIHPGGRSIVDVIAQQLALDESATSPAFDVLAEHGNMSSCTVLFVLARCLLAARRGGRVVAMACGPGLTLESMLFQVPEQMQ